MVIVATVIATLYDMFCLLMPSYLIRNFFIIILCISTNLGLYYKNFYSCNLRIFVISYSACPWQAFPAISR